MSDQARILGSRVVAQCRLCGSRRLTPVLDFGVQALSSYFPAPDEPDAPLAPLAVMLCEDCGLVQLRHDFDLDQLFRQSYGYMSGINDTMKRHLRTITSQIERLVRFAPGDVVLDIASNDGTLLKSYGSSETTLIGIDPTIAFFGEHYPPDCRKVAEFFDADVFRRLSDGRPARVITSIAVLYDVPDPNRFVADVAACLAADGVWALEQSYWPLLVRDGSFDSICHEHLCYFGLRQLRRLVEAHGLRIFDAQTNDMNGGSIRCFICHRDAAFEENGPALAALTQHESEGRLDDPATYRRFMIHIDEVRRRLRAILDGARDDRKTVHIYGASTKGNVLLQLFGIGVGDAQAAADRNPRKWGCRTPGTRIPIISEAESRASNPDYYLVLPWHFRDEFVAREADFRARGGKLIFPLPQVEIV